MIGIGEKLISQDPQVQYELLELLGGGRIAQVFLAKQTWPSDKEGHRVAIKLAASPAQNNRLESERRVLEALAGNPGFPKLETSGFNEEYNRRFLVMELIRTDRRLVQIARSRSEHRLEEDLGIETALQYARMLEALHEADYAATDRKLDDVIWDDESNPDAPRLIVLDWNVTAVDPAGQKRDLYQFGLFWYELLLGTPPPVGQDRTLARLDNHKHWENLTYSTRQILNRALHRVPALRYQTASELVKDLEDLAFLFGLGAEQLMNKAAEAEEADDPAGALTTLHVIRARFPEVWPKVKDRANEARRQVERRLDALLRYALKDLQQAQYSFARNRLERAQREQNLERTLRAERLLPIARLGAALEAEVEKLFRRQVLPELCGVEGEPGIVEDIESNRFRQAIERFWNLLTNAFLGPQGRDKVPTDFLLSLREAREGFEKGDRDLAGAKLREACVLLREPRPLQATLFGLMIGLDHPGEGGLLFLLAEALMQEKLNEATQEARTGDLRRAANLYRQAERLFQIVPYNRLLLQTGLEEPTKTRQLCERLANTLGKAEKCLSFGQELLEKRPPDSERALAELERGLSLWSNDVTEPNWARLRSKGKVQELRKVRNRASLYLKLQEVLETDNLALALEHCEILGEDPWGQEQRTQLKSELINQIERALGPYPVADDTLPEAADALSAARLVALARQHFPDDEKIQRRLPAWELQAVLALQGELNRLVAQAEEELRHGWRAGLKKVLDRWMEGHNRLRQAAHFSEILEREMWVAQEEKLDAVYEQVKHLAQLQRDITAEVAERRAAIDERERQRRKDRRQAEKLWQEAQTLHEDEGRPARRQAALDRAREALTLWPERRDIQSFVKRLENEIAYINSRFQQTLHEAQTALKEANYQQALAALTTHAPEDADLLQAQRNARRILQISIELLHQLDEARPAGESAAPSETPKRVEEIIELIDRTPEGWGDELMLTLQVCLDQIDLRLWNIYSELGVRKRSLKAQVAGALASVGLAKMRLERKHLPDSQNGEEETL